MSPTPVAQTAHPRRLRWSDLSDASAMAHLGQRVRVDGWLTAPDLTGHRQLVAEPPCCPGCLPGSSDGRIRIPASRHLAGGAVRLEGILRRDRTAWVLSDARPAARGIGRRSVLAAPPLLCLAAGAPQTDPRQAIAGMPTVDVHSHAGKLLYVRTQAPFTPVSEPMRQGGLAVACLAIVSDAPTHRIMADHRIHPYRDPAPGELHAYAQRAFARLHALAADQGMPIIADRAALLAARPDRPSAVVAAEGGDFLEGNPDRLDEAYARWQLRHLQLTHYRVNELGDIQTEEPVHGGLTDLGAEVVRRCNRLGIVVDVAHGTLDLVRRAATVTTKPLVLSHTSLTTRPRPFTRLITPEHARLIASTGGMVGIWPVAALFPDMAALAGGIARMAAIVGVDHVGLGTDSMGLVGPATFDSYAQLPDLAAALLATGFSVEDTRKIMGGNYTRVFAASLA
ncbi:MAG TPA: membrane dipeptidase [Rhodopila sp.]|nr:membrane dipeptidase [Rhodopila sp.]